MISILLIVIGLVLFFWGLKDLRLKGWQVAFIFALASLLISGGILELRFPEKDSVANSNVRYVYIVNSSTFEVKDVGKALLGKPITLKKLTDEEKAKASWSPADKVIRVVWSAENGEAAFEEFKSKDFFVFVSGELLPTNEDGTISIYGYIWTGSKVHSPYVCR